MPKHLPILAGFCLLITLTGCNFIGGSGGGNPTPGPDGGDDVAPVYTEDQHWEALAVLVENLEVSDTDEIVFVAQQLKRVGYLKDLARIEKFITGRCEAITDANKNHIANTLRGGA